MRTPTLQAKPIPGGALSRWLFNGAARGTLWAAHWQDDRTLVVIAPEVRYELTELTQREVRQRYPELAAEVGRAFEGQGFLYLEQQDGSTRSLPADAAALAATAFAILDRRAA